MDPFAIGVTLVIETPLEIRVSLGNGGGGGISCR